jgi:ribonuclease BN (tRNA processing enzyme)
MKVTVLGASGAWPTPGHACSGFLVEHEGFRLVMDLGYATLPNLLRVVPAEAVDGVLITHGHPDHCADLHPLLRARALAGKPPAALPVYTQPGALDAVLALDRPGMLDGAYRLHKYFAGERFRIGPFAVETWLLPHFLPNAGIRLTAGGKILAYTGDTGPSPDLLALAAGADLLIADASFAEEVPEDSRRYLLSGLMAGQVAQQAGVGRLLLTHLLPGALPQSIRAAARRGYRGTLGIARDGTVVDLGP